MKIERNLSIFKSSGVKGELHKSFGISNTRVIGENLEQDFIGPACIVEISKEGKELQKNST